MKRTTSLLLALITIIFIFFSCKKDPIKAENRNVLIIYDDTTTNVNTLSLKAAIEAAGYKVTFSDANESKWDNTNPSLDGFFGVVHLNGTTYDTEMPLAGQNALVDFVKNESGFYISAEWDGYQVTKNQMLAMQDLILLDRGNAENGIVTFIPVVEEAGHPVLNSVPATFDVDVDANGTAHVFAIDPSVVLVKEGSRDAVVVREFGNGKILGFHHSGNYNGNDNWSNTNIQKIVVNFFNWKQ